MMAAIATAVGGQLLRRTWIPAAELSTREVEGSIGPVRARWPFPAEQWAAYADGMHSTGLRGAWMWGVVAAAFAPFIPFGPDVTVSLKLKVAAALLLVTVLVSLRSIVTHRRLRRLDRPMVIVGRDGVIADGQPALYATSISRVRSVRRVTTQQRPELEIAYEFKGPSGIQHAAMRVPIPAGREDEADALADRYRNGGWYVDALPAETSR